VKNRIRIRIKVKRWKGHFGALEGLNLEKSEWYDPDTYPDPDKHPHQIERYYPDPHQSERNRRVRIQIASK
jgi:hypothetical protein